VLWLGVVPLSGFADDAVADALAEARAATGNKQAARQNYDALVRDFPKGRYTAYAHSALGFLHYEARDWQKARIHFARAAERAGSDGDLKTEALTMVGQCFLALSDHDQALKSFQTVLSEGAGEQEAQALLDLAGADRDAARMRLSFCKLQAPRSGTLTRVFVRQGQAIATNTSLATIVDLSSIFARLRVPGADLAQVKLGAGVVVHVASLPGTALQGTLERMSRQADQATSGVEVFVRIPNSDGRLVPGLACRAAISLPALEGAIVIPKIAVADRSGTAVVTVVKEGKAYEIPVQLGILVQDQVAVLSGIKAGETVVIEGGYALPDGYPVNVKE